MLRTHLDKANGILKELIELTKEDLVNINEAKHDGVLESVNKKAKLSSDFASAKASLDKALIELSNGSSKDLSELLSDDDKDQLGLLKENLSELHSINKQYAKLVLILKNFYDRMIKAMFKSDVSDTGKIQNSLLKLKI